MRKTTALAMLALIMLGTLSTSGSATDMVEIRLRGHYFSAPATVLVNIAIEPDAKNHKLLIEADGERYFRASEIELAGALERKIHTIEFRNLPEGEYTLRAELHSRTEIRGQARQDLRVMGVGGR